jgi:hypothetical protein
MSMDGQEEQDLINDPNPFGGPKEAGVADDETMGDLHGRTAHELTRMMTYGNARIKLAAINASIKFLKDNSITTTIKPNNPAGKVLSALPSVEELERLMKLSPGND